MIASAAYEPKYASERDRFYNPDGSVCSEVPKKDGKGVKKPTITEARQMGLVPSVTTVLGILDKPQLMPWAKKQVAITCADLLGPGEKDDLEDWAKWAVSRADAQMNIARDLGSEMHGEIQRLFTDREHYFPVRHPEAVNAALRALDGLGVLQQQVASERSFASVLGFGGCVDFSTEEIVVDFKCVDRLDKKMAWPDRCQQISAYNMGLFGELRRGANIFIRTVPDSDGTHPFVIHEWTAEDLAYGWAVFSKTLELWRVLNRYPVQQPPPHSGESR